MGSATHVFVTGGTGLIGRALVERLLRRGLSVTLMLRSGSAERRKSELEALEASAAGANGSLSQVTGDLCALDLGLSEAGLAALSKAGHCFHVAALYDIDADPDALERTNVDGTKHLLSALRKARFDGTLHHVSSVAVAGDYAETFTEAMFDEGQGLPHAYHRSKLESEKLVRESGLDYRIYRPSGVVGDSKTGAMDRIDGVYFGFGAIQEARVRPSRLGARAGAPDPRPLQSGPRGLRRGRDGSYRVRRQRARASFTWSIRSPLPS